RRAGRRDRAPGCTRREGGRNGLPTCAPPTGSRSGWPAGSLRRRTTTGSAPRVAVRRPGARRAAGPPAADSPRAGVARDRAGRPLRVRLGPGPREGFGSATEVAPGPLGHEVADRVEPLGGHVVVVGEPEGHREH